VAVDVPQDFIIVTPSQRRYRAWVLVDCVPVNVGLRSNAQDHDGYDLIGHVLVVLDGRQDLPDDSVAVSSCMDGEAALPFLIQRVAKVGCALDGIKEATRSVNLAICFRVPLLEQPQICSCFGCQRQFVSL
jgi:hypothetical protein